VGFPPGGDAEQGAEDTGHGADTLGRGVARLTKNRPGERFPLLWGICDEGLLDAPLHRF
jgi:hypothetical protein